MAPRHHGEQAKAMSRPLAQGGRKSPRCQGLPVSQDIRTAGAETLNGIEHELNARSILAARGGQWYATTVRNHLARI